MLGLSSENQLNRLFGCGGGVIIMLVCAGLPISVGAAELAAHEATYEMAC